MHLLYIQFTVLKQIDHQMEYILTFKDHLLKSHDNIQSQLFRKHNWSLNVYKLKEISWKTNSRGQAVSNLQWEIKLFISL